MESRLIQNLVRNPSWSWTHGKPLAPTLLMKGLQVPITHVDCSFKLQSFTHHFHEICFVFLPDNFNSSCMLDLINLLGSLNFQIKREKGKKKRIGRGRERWR